MKNDGRIRAATFWALLVVGTISVKAATPTNWDAAAQSWWAHVQYLADDNLKGRYTGSAGFKLATEYVEKQFRAAGLQPAGTAGFSQEVKFDVFRLDPSHTSWELETDGQRTPVQLGTDALVHAYEGAGESVDA